MHARLLALLRRLRQRLIIISETSALRVERIAPLAPLAPVES